MLVVEVPSIGISAGSCGVHIRSLVDVARCGLVFGVDDAHISPLGVSRLPRRWLPVAVTRGLSEGWWWGVAGGGCWRRGVVMEVGGRGG